MAKKNKNKERALAHIEKIEFVKPIPGADNIELIGVLGWECIAKKNEFKVGDLAVYIEIDSKVPEKDERFKFLESKHYKVKIMKLGKFGVISQGLALPLELFPELKDKKIGDDVTKELGIKYSSLEDQRRKSNTVDKEAKYKNMAARNANVFKKPFIRKLMKNKVCREILWIIFGKKKDKPRKFPDWIIKTDEDRIENCPYFLGDSNTWIVTEKEDGSSCTYAVNRVKKLFKTEYEFIICSRNVRIVDKNQECYHKTNIYWDLAEKYNIETKLIKFAKENGYDRVVIQGEGVGSVQGNPYKLQEDDLYLFNLVIDGDRKGMEELIDFSNDFGFKHVPLLHVLDKLPETMEEMKQFADGYSVLNPKVKREGLVYRSPDGKKSFKNVSREYLLKHSK